MLKLCPYFPWVMIADMSIPFEICQKLCLKIYVSLIICGFPSHNRTRIHFSRMCTVRNSGCWGGVYPSMHWVGGCVSQHALDRGVCVCPSMHWAGGVCPGGCLPQCMLGYTHPLWTEWLTDACENITLLQLADGNNLKLYVFHYCIPIHTRKEK